MCVWGGGGGGGGGVITNDWDINLSCIVSKAISNNPVFKSRFTITAHNYIPGFSFCRCSSKSLSFNTNSYHDIAGIVAGPGPTGLLGKLSVILQFKSTSS